MSEVTVFTAEGMLALYNDNVIDFRVTSGGDIYMINRLRQEKLIGNIKGPIGPNGSVSSVNGKTGSAITLSATDIGIIYANVSQAGLIELATTAEVLGRTDTTRALTPANINSHPGVPWAMATGKQPIDQIAQGATGNLAVSFPTGRFTQPPVVVITSGTTRYTMQVTEGLVTKDGFSVLASNWSPAPATASSVFHWMAIQMLTDSGVG